MLATPSNAENSLTFVRQYLLYELKMKNIKVASGALNQTPLDWDQNFKNIADCIKEASDQGVSILCLPELCITGYGCEDAFYAPYVQKKALDYLEEIKKLTADMVVTVGLPLVFQNKIYNAACVIADKNILGFNCKQHLPNYGVFYEDRWFQRWPKGQKGDIRINDFVYPVGDFCYELDNVKIGIEICEDAWVPDRPAKRHYEKGVDIILNPSASPFEFNKFYVREQLVEESSRTFGCTYIYTNLLGNESGRLIFDGDAMIAVNGELVASSPRFSYADHTLTIATIDADNSKVQQSVIKSHVDKQFQVNYKFTFPENVPVTDEKAILEPFEKGGYLKEEEFARAVCLGLFDYMRKSYSNGFTVSLSGGADSSACVALAGLMVRLADESIGIKKVTDKLAYNKKLKGAKSITDITQEIIHTIYQGTDNSSKETLEAAQNLAESIGAVFYNIKIDDLVASYTTLIEDQIDKKLNWEDNDIALQNIQARVRAPGVWLWTNLTNHLLLATSNRSEVAVGYCTMDGDTAGSISPISGIDKHWLRHWLRWLENTGCEVKGKHITIDGLKYVNRLSPTAELRPQGQMQTDEKDLMPYEVLNVIEGLALEKRLSPRETYQHVSHQYKGQFDPEELLLFTTRFFKLWSRNQWKRERYAPGFHLDGHNLDSRSWCRFPILNGAYKQELLELEEYFKNGISEDKPSIGFKIKK